MKPISYQSRAHWCETAPFFLSLCRCIFVCPLSPRCLWLSPPRRLVEACLECVVCPPAIFFFSSSLPPRIYHLACRCSPALQSRLAVSKGISPRRPGFSGNTYQAGSQHNPLSHLHLGAPSAARLLTSQMLACTLVGIIWHGFVLEKWHQIQMHFLVVFTHMQINLVCTL